MFCETHVIYIGLLGTGIGKQDRIIPEAEPVNSIITLCHTEEGLSVVPFYSGHQIIFPVQLDGTRIHHCIDAQSLHKVRIGLGI